MKESNILKSICYICIPMFIVIIIFSLIYSIYIAENEEILNAENYEETQLFRQEYEQQLYNIISTIGKKYYHKKITESETLQYEAKTIYMRNYSDLAKDIDYVIIDNTNNNIYTNLDVYNINSIQEKIKSKDEIYLKYITKNKTIDTNIKNLTNISQNIQTRINYAITLDSENNIDIEIYTKLSDKYIITSDIHIQRTIFQIAKQLKLIPIILMPIFIIFTIMMTIYLYISIGHKKQYDGIYLNKLDKFPLDLLSIICIFLVSTFIAITAEIINSIYIAKAHLYINYGKKQ